MYICMYMKATTKTCHRRQNRTKYQYPEMRAQFSRLLALALTFWLACCWSHKRCLCQLSYIVLAVDDGRASIIVLLLSDPPPLEAAESRNNRTPNPSGDRPVRRRQDLDICCGWCYHLHLLGHPLAEAREHGGATSAYNVRKEFPPIIKIVVVRTASQDRI